MPRVGILGSLVWDQIYGRDALAEPVQEWGGIAYALAGLDASVAPGWEIVPLIKVGQDLAPRAREFLGGLRHLTPGGRCVEVPEPNNRVVLRYYSSARRTERMSGGVPGWTWSELGPMVRDLDALYLNFISGFELALGTAQALRQGFQGPIYCDLHSLLLGMRHDGVRVPRPLHDAGAWLGCFDVVQLNEDEMRQLSPDPMSLAADAIGAGTSLLIVTLAAKGAAYVAAPGFDGWDGAVDGRTGGPADRRTGGQTEGRTGGQTEGRTGGRAGDGTETGADGGLAVAKPGELTGPSARPPVRASAPLRTALIPAPTVEALDPTGCGDVFGAAAAARLFAGDPVEQAIRHANAMAARNVAYRGAGGLSRHLRGELVLP